MRTFDAEGLPDSVPAPPGTWREAPRFVTRPSAADKPTRDPSPQDELAGLVARLAAGDSAALGPIYDATADRVFAVAKRFMLDPAAAEDVALEVFVQVWRNASQYDASRATVVTWLLMICRSRCLDALRTRAGTLPPGDFPDLADADAGPNATLEEVEHREQRLALSSALRALSPTERQLVALGFYRGLTHSEMALHAGMPLGTVKATMRRALRKLRVLMEHGKGGIDGR